MNAKWKQAFSHFIPFAIVVTFLCVLSYGIGQQVLRQTVDDVPVQMAEDAASLLSAGQAPESVIPAQRIDMGRSLAPFLIIYNSQQNVLASSGTIDGHVPPIPGGVLNAAKTGEDRITWQPTSTVRDAVVVVAYTGKQSGYVLAGRSLREVENHSNGIFTMVVLVWILCLVVLYGYFLFAESVREFLRGEKIKQFTTVKNRKR